MSRGEHVFSTNGLRRRVPYAGLRSRSIITERSESATLSKMLPLASVLTTAVYCMAYSLSLLFTPHLRHQEQMPVLSVRGLAHFGCVALFALAGASLVMQRKRYYRAYEKQWLALEQPGLNAIDHEQALVRQQRIYQMCATAMGGLFALLHCGTTERLLEPTMLLLQLGVMAGLGALAVGWVNDMQEASWRQAPSRFA